MVLVGKMFLGETEGVRAEVFGSEDEFMDEDRRRWEPLRIHTARMRRRIGS